MVGSSDSDVVMCERKASVTQVYIGSGKVSLRGVMQKEIMTMLDSSSSSYGNSSETSSLSGHKNKVIKKLEVIYELHGTIYTTTSLLACSFVMGMEICLFILYVAIICVLVYI
jgi:hypothetical protein